MPREPRDARRPHLSPSGESLIVRLSSGSVVVIRRDAERCTIRLAFGRSMVGPDVSVQPGAVVEVVDQQARQAGADPNAWRLDVLRGVREWEPALDWCTSDHDQLVAALGALTHPLLGAVYASGATGLGDVPRWASPILRTTSPADAARALTGGRTTRRVIRALAGSLVASSDRVDLTPLSLAVAAAGRISLDELANVLEARRTGGPPTPPVSVAQVTAIRTGLAGYPAQRRAPLLLDAATSHGPATLADALIRLAWVDDLAPRPLPVRVDDLVALCGRLVPVLAPPPLPQTAADRTPAPGGPTRPRGPATGTAPAAAAPAAPSLLAAEVAAAAGRARSHHQGRRALTAPATPGRAPERWPVPAALRSISGLTRDGLTFCVPTSTNELDWWGRQLHNCLDSFAAAAAAQRSWLIGIRRDDHLIGCVEICPTTHRIRQAHGPRNHRLPDTVYDVATAVLAEHGLLRVRRP